MAPNLLQKLKAEFWTVSVRPNSLRGLPNERSSFAGLRGPGFAPRDVEAREFPSWPGGVAATSRNSAKHPRGADGVVDTFQAEFFVGVRTTTPSVPASVASQYFLCGTATPPG